MLTSNIVSLLALKTQKESLMFHIRHHYKLFHASDASGLNCFYNTCQFVIYMLDILLQF